MKVKFTMLILSALILTHIISKAQNTFPSSGSAGIGTTTPDASSLLELKSTTKGLLIPRMTKAQRDAIATPAVGLMIYQTTVSPGFFYYNGTVWAAISSKGANTALSNLIAPTAVNVDLLPNANNVISIGSSALKYKDVNLYNLKFADGTVQTTAATGSSSQWTTSGSNIYNNNTGNVGIGITTPTLGGLVVNTKAGAVNAMFGSTTTGVAIESNYPGIGLNTYYNGGRKFIAAGYGGLIGIDPTSGLMGFYNSATSGTTAGTATLIADLAITASGNIGIGTTTPTTGGLVVNTKAGAVNAMFGSNTTGVAIESANPGIGLNTYYNNGRKFIAAGYGAVIGLDPASGLLGFYNSAASGSAGTASAVNADMVITASGNVGITNTSPQAPLSFANGNGNKIDLYYNSANNRYGIGITTGVMQFYTGVLGNNFQFGYGSSTSFKNSVTIGTDGSVQLTGSNAGYIFF